MELLSALGQGFSVALSPGILVYCFIGVFIGTTVGVLPGLGPTATMSMLLPVTFHLDPTGSIIMLAGIYYGAQYGGTITSVLLNIPGCASTIVSCIDGHAMAKLGRAGPALGMAAFASLIAGMASVVGIALIGPPLAQVALRFGPPEQFSLIVLGLLLVTFISSGSRLRSVMSALTGLILSSVGLDIVSGQQRFIHGIPYFYDGIGLIMLAMGLFGIAEILSQAARPATITRPIKSPTTRELLPTAEDWRRSAAPIGRGTVLGFLLGLMPGGGAMIASFASYICERKVSRRPQAFGRGAIEGVAGPDAANSAAAQSNFVPLLNLGIPGNATMGVMMGAFLIHGINPGPLMFTERPDLFWGIITSMVVGNIILVVLNVPMIGFFVRLLQVPRQILAPLIMLVCIVGAFSLKNSIYDVLMMLLAGLAGYLMRKSALEAAPLLVAFVLGTMLESSMQQSLALGRGSAMIFFNRPISATLLGLCALVVVTSMIIPLVRLLLRRRTRSPGLQRAE